MSQHKVPAGRDVITLVFTLAEHPDPVVRDAVASALHNHLGFCDPQLPLIYHIQEWSNAGPAGEALAERVYARLTEGLRLRCGQAAPIPMQEDTEEETEEVAETGAPVVQPITIVMPEIPARGRLMRLIIGALLLYIARQLKYMGNADDRRAG